MDTGSPKGSPPTMAILPPALAITGAENNTARSLSLKVQPGVEPDEEQLEPDPKASLQLASLGIELALKEKEAIRLERDVITEQRDAGILHPKAAGKLLCDLNQRYLSAGDDLWRHQKKKIRSDPGIVRLLEPRGNDLSECLLALYKKCDGLSKTGNPPSHWRQDAMTYYTGSGNNHGTQGQNAAWCHISGMWHHPDSIKAAHIVPFFPDTAEIGEILFGNRAESLLPAGNALLLSKNVKGWWDSYHFVVVPVNAKKTPISRWRTEFISTDIKNLTLGFGHTAKELDGKELIFLNEKRPVSRFLCFHFIMTLVHVKDIKRPGWQDVWARYYDQCPFPTPGNYMRQSMLLALATHFGAVDMHVVESWIMGHGFDSPLKLTDDETMEAARRVHLAVEATISRAEKSKSLEEESSEDSSEEED
ncbi:hypothetical protein F4677DRAFT_456499 [Hypoxylon crocopeplum]|nr:hypothetical protein F4677DRAFT_456499 [Hypoxylon crocopeplum]